MAAVRFSGGATRLTAPTSAVTPVPHTPWWRAPLPAWAQAAAALLIFGAGLTLGLLRPPASTAQASRQPADAAAADVATRTELSQLEQRLKSELTGMRTAAAALARQPASADAEIMKKVNALVAQSEERQRREFTLRSVEMARDFEAQVRTCCDDVFLGGLTLRGGRPLQRIRSAGREHRPDQIEARSEVIRHVRIHDQRPPTRLRNREWGDMIRACISTEERNRWHR